MTLNAQRTVAAAIRSMAGLSVTYCPRRLARYLADSSHGSQSLCGRWPVCCAVGADASPLAVSPHQSPLWLTGKAKTRASLPVRGGNLGALLRVDRQPISGLQVNIVPTVPANGTLIIYPVVVLRTHGKQFSWYPRAR